MNLKEMTASRAIDYNLHAHFLQTYCPVNGGFDSSLGHNYIHSPTH